MFIVCPECRQTDSVNGTVDSHTCSRCGRTVPVRSTAGQPSVSADDTPSLTDTLSLAVSAPPPAEEVSSVPEMLGRYRIQRLLGEGGYSRVYLARDEQLERLVALKVPKVERFRTDESLVAFFDEARTVANLEHPYIVRVYDVGRDNATGTRFIVMQHVDGHSLHHRIKARPLSFTESAQIVRQVALAIHFAHKQQFFHRDLKPSNILLGSGGEPYVADFGLAVREQSQYKHAGELAGTLPYMAPEQIRGESHRLDGRTDIWALGVVLYRLLAGRTPFSGERAQIADDILNREPRPPRQIDESIPKELERITLKCLNKPVNQRYSSGFDLAEDLQAWLDEQSDSSQSTRTMSVLSPVPEPAQIEPAARSKTISAHWGILALIGLGLVGILAGGGALAVIYRSDPGITQTDRDLPEIDSRPWNVDLFATTGRWYPLLDIEPKEIIFSKGWDAATWHFDREIQQLNVDMPDIAMLETGETAADSYRLQVTIAKSTWDGSAGIFWAYEELEDGERVARCRIVEVVAFPGRDGVDVRVNYDHLDLLYSATAPRPGLFRDRIHFQPVTIPDFQDNVLEVWIKRGQLVRACWRGQPLDRLTESEKRREFVPPLGKSRFGLVSSQGATVFRDARFRLDNGGRLDERTAEGP